MKNSTSKDRQKQWSHGTHSKEGTLDSMLFQMGVRRQWMPGAGLCSFGHGMIGHDSCGDRQASRWNTKANGDIKLFIQSFFSKIIFSKNVRCTNSNYLNFICFWAHKYLLPDTIKQYVNWYFSFAKYKMISNLKVKKKRPLLFCDTFHIHEFFFVNIVFPSSIY